MKRTRRGILWLVVFGFLGVVATWVVAWGNALWAPQPPSPSFPHTMGHVVTETHFIAYMRSRGPGLDVVAWLIQRLDHPASAMIRPVIDDVRRTGKTSLRQLEASTENLDASMVPSPPQAAMASATTSPGYIVGVSEIHLGWPMRCLYGTRTSFSSTPDKIVQVRESGRIELGVPGESRALAYLPMWWGLLANSALYGGCFYGLALLSGTVGARGDRAPDDSEEAPAAAE